MGSIPEHALVRVRVVGLWGWGSWVAFGLGAALGMAGGALLQALADLPLARIPVQLLHHRGRVVELARGRGRVDRVRG